MNHNILETIMSKTMFPVYLLEYGWGDRGTHEYSIQCSWKFKTKIPRGLYHTREELKISIDRLLEQEIEEQQKWEQKVDACLHTHKQPLYVTIIIISKYGDFSDGEKEEYMYMDGGKYQRIMVEYMNSEREDEYRFNDYTYKKIE